ncbi:winged helix-turn-helix transcriptional regulator [Cytobacillus massiliigabonensis]|uniref:winged helix-turn-helix transcriptional regulator n=1 Tax=Cytobacillus massiliigabonensis TaxID=1871011 RepID=UPI000C846DAE|nr:helix-turn-helix domain-containing protein [Cytobacillus massiliigabonensis]
MTESTFGNNKQKDCQNICNDFHSTIEFLGKRWMGIIIYSLFKGPKRYHEILENIPGISDRLLTERLRDLEKEGLIVKRILTTPKKKVEYELTQSGKKLEDVFLTIVEWTQAKNES